MARVSISNITAGLVAMLVGFTSSIAIVFQAAAATGATTAEMSSWVLALGIGVGLTTIGLSWRYRVPILITWSTPGAALLVTSLAGVSLAQAVGAFVFVSILIFLCGITGIFEKWMSYIPQSLATAVLAGVLFHFGTNIFVSMQTQCTLVLGMFIMYFLGNLLFPRWVILFTLFLGIVIAKMQGLIHLQDLHFVFSKPIFTWPVFSIPVLLSIGIPLFIVTMASQNIPGIAALETSGYRTPTSSILSCTGLTNFLLAPFGGFSFNLAAITAAICLNDTADPNPAARYKATLCAGTFYLIAGIFGATVVTLFSILPMDLIWTLTGLALLGTLTNSMRTALDKPNEREAALIAFLVTASGMTLFQIGSAFWGLVFGIAVLSLLKSQRFLQERREAPV